MSCIVYVAGLFQLVLHQMKFTKAHHDREGSDIAYKLHTVTKSEKERHMITEAVTKKMRNFAYFL